MDAPDEIESEFGVPIPGQVVDPAQWAKTAIKKLPEPGPVDWNAIFGRPAPLVIDLGCGNGRHVLGSAWERRDLNHVGVDLLPVVLRYATRRGNQRGLTNLRFACCDGKNFVRRYLADRSVREMHIYHPQPFHNRREAWKRLLQPEFLADVARTLEPQGRLFLQTDNAPYWDYLRKTAPSFFEFEERDERWPDSPRTRREILASSRGLPIFRGVGVVREMAAEEARTLATKLPRPTFDAGKPQRELDDLERDS
ncbi:MAG: methyltransferase domain-containing protein [Gemmataceae bacterium]|nr:methyltransferase domain-containing protein [Gemmataceae bacterium]